MKKLLITLIVLGICSLFAQDIPQNNPPLITAVYLFPVPHHEEGLEILYSGGDTEALDVYKDGHWFQTITDEGRYVEILHVLDISMTLLIRFVTTKAPRPARRLFKLGLSAHWPVID